MPQLSKAQQYVAMKHALDALWVTMSETERAEAQSGLAWLEVIGGNGGTGKKRGRPPGSRNKTMADRKEEKSNNGS